MLHVSARIHALPSRTAVNGPWTQLACILRSVSRSVAGDSAGRKTPFLTLMPLPTSNACSIRPTAAEAAASGARSLAAPAASRDVFERRNGGEICEVRCTGRTVSDDGERVSDATATAAAATFLPGRMASALMERTSPRALLLAPLALHVVRSSFRPTPGVDCLALRGGRVTRCSLRPQSAPAPAAPGPGPPAPPPRPLPRRKNWRGSTAESAAPNEKPRVSAPEDWTVGAAAAADGGPPPRYGFGARWIGVVSDSSPPSAALAAAASLLSSSCWCRSARAELSELRSARVASLLATAAARARFCSPPSTRRGELPPLLAQAPAPPAPPMARAEERAGGGGATKRAEAGVPTPPGAALDDAMAAAAMAAPVAAADVPRPPVQGAALRGDGGCQAPAVREVGTNW
jgi:hypothetical protein